MNVEDLKLKWIIQDGHLILGKVKYHTELVTDLAKVKGGGLWDMDIDSNVILLYGSSSDYGYASIEDVSAAVQAGNCDATHREGRYNEFSYFYSTFYKLEEAKHNRLVIDKVAKVKEDDL